MFHDDNDGHTLADTILAALLSGRSTRTFYRIRRELALKREKEASARTALHRLKKRGLVSLSQDGWGITIAGKKYLENRDLFELIPSPFPKNAPATNIVSFDVPQTHKKERDWLRSQLKLFDYRMLQQSLWTGPGPLPKEFTDRLHRLSIKNCVRIFKIK